MLFEENFNVAVIVGVFDTIEAFLVGFGMNEDLVCSASYSNKPNV